MAQAPRPRKRVCAFRRAPDGSAFQKCGTCGVSVVVALADLHHCETKMDAKRFKGLDGNRYVPQIIQGSNNQPASAFRLFMESFKKGYEMENEIVIERLGFEKWKSMSVQEKHPFIFRSRVLDRAHQAALDKEAYDLAKMKVNDEADSAMVNKVDKVCLLLSLN
ncbi:high mobility group B protein 3 [Gastrolobium bilobum]|uniref:high mobility group B protein 3 n=1 Tax=Gastrolobium bilobum TaxID=150636 RepID=UPI002AAF5C30|nr:high mobility group B protein 3 [Gastrolobium bilobum]